MPLKEKYSFPAHWFIACLSCMVLHLAYLPSVKEWSLNMVRKCHQQSLHPIVLRVHLHLRFVEPVRLRLYGQLHFFSMEWIGMIVAIAKIGTEPISEHSYSSIQKIAIIHHKRYWKRANKNAQDRNMCMLISKCAGLVVKAMDPKICTERMNVFMLLRILFSKVHFARLTSCRRYFVFFIEHIKLQM